MQLNEAAGEFAALGSGLDFSHGQLSSRAPDLAVAQLQN